MKKKSSRRDFLKKTVATGIGITVFPQILPASTLGRGGAIAPNDRIAMAVIGAGSRGMSNVDWFNQNREIQFIAACDVDAKHRDRAKAVIDKHNKNSDLRTYLDYRELLEKWQQKGWRIDSKTVNNNRLSHAYAIPSPGRKHTKGWVVDSIPML